MNLISHFRFAPLLLAMLVLHACTSGIIGTASYDEQGRYEMETSTQNAIIGMRLSIDDIRTSRVNDLLVANIQFRSKWFFTQEIKYRLHWFDSHGMEVYPERASWNSIVLTGRSTKTIMVTAPNSSVDNLKVYVRD